MTKATSIDKVIGARLKVYRQRENQSQAAVGKHLKISFQQVQKYENGTNRVSAAALFKIASFLKITVGELVALDGPQLTFEADRKEFALFTKSSEGKSLMQGFLAIRSPSLRRQILSLVQALGR